jgi:hypothetical protein
MELNKIVIGAGGNTIKDVNGAELLALYPNVLPQVADSFLITDDDDNSNLKTVTIRDVISLSVLDAFTSGTLASFNSTATPTPLPVFNNVSSFYSSSPVAIKTAGDLGLTTSAPIRWDVTCTVDIRTASNDDFFIQVYAGGLPVGETQALSGNGTNKSASATIQAITGLLDVMDTIELRVWDGGQTITNIIATMSIRFAGVD